MNFIPSTYDFGQRGFIGGMKLNAPSYKGVTLGESLDGEPTAYVRRHIRYPLRAPVSFTWFNREGTGRDAKGHSSNICEGGAYILTRNCPPVGAQIILTFRFPFLSEFADFHLLEMSGQVVRAEVSPGRKGMWGFAVASAWSTLQEREDSEIASKDSE